MRRIICFLFLSGLIASLSAVVKLPAYISDNMMIQRDMPFKLFGWSDPNETVTVIFNGQPVKAKADKAGTWNAQLKAMPYGGPYEMSVKGKTNNIVIRNILIGDIWVCSGQSNMEWITYNVNQAAEEMAAAGYPQIRLLNVTKNMSVSPSKDIETVKGWQECSPQTVGDFSAVGYFFGRELYKQLNIPIGLINSSWGGTMIETWTSIPAMSGFPAYKELLNELKASNFEERLAPRNDEYIRNISDTDPGTKEKWYLPTTDLSEWKTTDVPGFWNKLDAIGEGVVWYRKEFSLTGEQAKGAALISFGGINDWDETYLNGKKIGSMQTRSAQRDYVVCSDELAAGKNILTVKIVSVGRFPGFPASKEKMYCQTNSGKISLAGEWQYRIAALSSEMFVGVNTYPSLIYNAMIAPLAAYPVKGVIWYQGESNASDAYNYRALFPNMITDWRNAWKQPDLPFYFVQLAGYDTGGEKANLNYWAELREAQHKTLSMPYTGEAVTIDIGDAKDIHPKNKQGVGYRLALNALAKTYGKSLVFSGPEYRSMQIDGNKIILTFDHAENGLIVKGKYEYLQGFAIASEDQPFVYAQAYIHGNTVTVFSDKVKNPVAVRYAWENNPEDANLFNAEGLPASPFRTDNRQLNTQK